MTDHDTEPLVQWQTYHGSPAQQALETESIYVQLREAFYAGYAARPRPGLEPSPNALEYAERPLARYASQRVEINRDRYPHKTRDGSADYLPAPDYTQPVPPLARRDTDYADKAWRFAEVYGVEPAKVAGPDPETLERIHDQLKRKGVAEYPEMPLEHTETVWDGDTTMQFGARGPVPTIPGLQEGEDGSS